MDTLLYIFCVGVGYLAAFSVLWASGRCREMKREMDDMARYELKNLVGALSHGEALSPKASQALMRARGFLFLEGDRSEEMAAAIDADYYKWNAQQDRKEAEGAAQ